MRALCAFALIVGAGTVRAATGTVSFYGWDFQGRRTAYGERFDCRRLTLASRTLPYGTRVRVTGLRTHRSAVGIVTDWGPSRRYPHRIADLSLALARKVGIDGLGKAKLEVLGRKRR